MIGTILNNETRQKQVTRTHRELGDMFSGLTLEDVLIVGYNWPRHKIEKVMNDRPLYKKLKKFFYRWDYTGDDYQLSDFKLYNQPAITRHARYRAVFLQDMKKKGYDLSEPFFGISELERFSLLGSEYNTVLYAIKCYMLSSFGEEIMCQYEGLQPQTGPVHNAVAKLFCVEESNFKHSIRCNNLAKEIGVSSTHINTALYFLG